MIKKSLLLALLFSSTAFAESTNKFSYTPDGYLVSIRKTEQTVARNSAKDTAREPESQQQEVLKTAPAEAPKNTL